MHISISAKYLDVFSFNSYTLQILYLKGEGMYNLGFFQGFARVNSTRNMGNLRKATYRKCLPYSNALFKRHVHRKKNTCYSYKRIGKWEIFCRLIFIINQLFILLAFQGNRLFLFLRVSDDLKNKIDKNDRKTCVTSYHLYFQCMRCCFI